MHINKTHFGHTAPLFQPRPLQWAGQVLSISLPADWIWKLNLFAVISDYASVSLTNFFIASLIDVCTIKYRQINSAAKKQKAQIEVVRMCENCFSYHRWIVKLFLWFGQKGKIVCDHDFWWRLDNANNSLLQWNKAPGRRGNNATAEYLKEIRQ